MREMPSGGHTWRAPIELLPCRRRSLGNRPLAAELGQEVVQVIVTRVAYDQFSRPLFPRLDLDLGSDLFGQFFLETCHVAVAVPASGLGRGMKDGVHEPLRLAHRERLVSDPLRSALLLPAVEREKRARVSHLELSVENQRLDRLLQIQQPEQIGGCGAGPADGLRRLLVRELELADQPLHAACFLERVEVFPLDVLDQRHGERRRIRHVANERRDFLETGDFRRAPASLPCDDLVTVTPDRPHENGLHQSLLPDRCRELLKRVLVHLGARLVTAALQLIDAQRGLPLGDGPSLAILVEEGIQAPAQPLEFHRRLSFIPPPQCRSARGSPPRGQYRPASLCIRDRALRRERRSSGPRRAARCVESRSRTPSCRNAPAIAPTPAARAHCAGRTWFEAALRYRASDSGAGGPF